MAGERFAVLTAPEVDDELLRLGADGDRMTDALGALEDHPGRLFLDSARLTGRTAAAWIDGKATMAVLYQRFDAYRDVLGRAREVRARRQRPGQTELAELAALLRGPAVTLSSEDIPLDRRTLAGPATVTHRRTMAELVAEMDAAYRDVTGLVVAVDDVRSAAVRTLDPLAQRLDSARELAGSLGLGEANDPLFLAIGTLGDELADIQELAFADPLALHAGPLGAGAGGHPDLDRARRVEDELTGVLDGLDGLARVRAGLAETLARVAADIDGVDSQAAAARTARATVLDKIASPAIADVSDAAADLRGLLRAATESSTRGNWPRVADELAELDTRVAAALADVRSVRETADALLGRRAELRGRLDAYRVKVARLRHSEDAELAECYRQAHDLLWTVPCDLRAATEALVRYQELIADRGPAR